MQEFTIDPVLVPTVTRLANDPLGSRWIADLPLRASSSASYALKMLNHARTTLTINGTEHRGVVAVLIDDTNDVETWRVYAATER